MSKFWSSIAGKVEPYVPGEQPKDKKYVKLNTNECPYPPSEKVLAAIKENANGDLRLYPDPNCDRLRETAAKYYELDKNQIFVGNGSDEILALAFLAYFDQGDRIIYSDITYSFYKVYAEFFKVNSIIIPLNEDFSIPVEKYLQKNDGILICNPNAPTGKEVEIYDILKILEANANQIVIVDEAYIDFGGQSAVGLINKYPNLLVVHTLSKSRALAGLRVGFALGNSDLIEALNRVKNSFNSYTLDRLALVGAEEAIKDEKHFQEIRNKIIVTRETISGRLKDIGFLVIDSTANFIFISHNKIPAEQIFQKLRENNVLVRYFNKPRIDNFLRVTIGTDEEMDIFYDEISKIVE